ncbi:DNA polymerase III subunit epsilon [Lachnoclostridium sp. An169]|uniref:3'-5' exonuclease n=1 Tax=Lachnoclostridium sp. An169 TaxID=1965569 RepID=UPI000B36D191|nr:3'-5' exonuclease [Lachnoclostridium sp. An169]OUP82682.1 DNA polymerase III subunit epsilon [Lachnoclostridium sp. An169]HJA65429.1 3'-5' exonuclease [Candidatus Mediterraneibacter cottocaccae]
MLKSYIAFDVETTGLDPQENEIIEIGALKVRDGKVADRFMEFIHPLSPISTYITGLTGITNDMVADARPRKQVVSDFIDFCEDDVLIGHNVSFDYSFMKCSAARDGMAFEKLGIDTLKIAQKVHSSLDSKSLGSLCEYYHIENKSAHRAYHDALATAKLYQTLAHYFEAEAPELFSPKQLVYRVKRPQPATPKQISFLTNLIRKKGVEIQWDPETITRSEASRLIDGLLKS